MYQSKTQRVFLARTALATAVSASLLLAACGGGGGGGNGGGTSAAASASLVINDTNAKPVAADALFSATSTDAAQAGTQFVTGVQLDTGSATGGSLQFAAAAQVIAGKLKGVQSPATGVTISETIPCTSGTLTITGNVADANSITAGDNVTVVANSCVETVNGVSSTLAGQMHLTINDTNLASSSNFPFHLSMTVESSGLSVTANGKTTQTTGDMTLDATLNSSTSESLVVSGKSLSSTSGSRTYTLKNYSQSVSVNNGTATYNVTAEVDTQNARLGTGVQVYFVSTPTPLTGTTAGSFSGGVLKVTGKSSALQLTVTGANTYKIDVDANGDGSFESSTTSTTTELRSLI